ncbi:piezo-type mechanosensitive ion channel component 2-like [Lampetra fluviatilis]
MMVLIAVYTFQFDDLPPLWMSMTRLNIDQLKDLGLEKFTTPDLFTRILLPTAFLLCCILQLHYFHDRFLRLTDLNLVWRNEESVAYRMATDEGSLPDLSLIPDKGPAVAVVTPEERTAEPRHHGDDDDEEEEDEDEEEEGDPDKWRLVLDRLWVLLLRSMELLRRAQGFAWRLLELHIIKLASFYTVWVALREVSLLNYALIIAWGFALPFPRVRRAASATCAVWVCVVAVGKMLYQLHIVDSAAFSTNCTVPVGMSDDERRGSLLYRGPVDPANWVGLRKADNIALYIRDHLMILAVLVLEVTVYRRQAYCRAASGEAAPPTGAIFPGVTRGHMDRSVPLCLKYFLNYFFYKFGLEVCFLMTINAIGQRMDLYAMLHGFWLVAIVFQRKRVAMARLWPRFCLYLACSFTFQYLLCIGVPPVLCHDYPWKSAGFNPNLVKWLFLPDFRTRPTASMLICTCASDGL